MANKVNDWEGLLRLANNELNPMGFVLRCKENEDGNYTIRVYDGNSWETFADGYFEYELSSVIDEAWAYANAQIRELEEDGEVFRYRKIHGWTHDDPALIYAFTETTLFFRDDETGEIENVDKNSAGIDAYEDRKGCFCVIASEYDKAYRQLEAHDNGYEF